MPEFTSPAPARMRVLATLLLLLTVFGPISMDLYLPALPALTDELGAATSIAQLTVTACLIGLAAGQLVAGPVSDRFGRRRVVLIGIGAYVLTSALCAISPTVELLIGARLVQGFAGGVGIVIAQAAGRDIYSGGALIRFYGRLTVIGGFAAIVGPLIGGALSSVTDWRGLFAFLSLIGVVILAATAAGLPETLPAENRSTGGFAETLDDFRTLLGDPLYRGAIMSQGFLNAALFAYLAGATYVLQGVYGLSPQAYAAAFGMNSAGFMIFGFIAGRTSERWSLHGTLVVGIVVTGAGAVGLLTAGITSVPLVVVLLSLLALASGVAIATPPSTTLALVGYPQIAGTASSLLGMVRFGFGAVAAPLVGVAGAAAILPLGVVTVTAVLLAAGSAYLGLTQRPAGPGAAARPTTALAAPSATAITADH